MRVVMRTFLFELDVSQIRNGEEIITSQSYAIMHKPQYKKFNLVQFILTVNLERC